VLGEVGHASALRQVLPDKAIDVFVGAAFPGVMRRREVEAGPCARAWCITVHVVYRMSIEDSSAAISKLDVFPLRRMGVTWRGLLAADFRMLGAVLRRQGRT
jgi:hypothetical protein